MAKTVVIIQWCCLKLCAFKFASKLEANVNEFINKLKNSFGLLLRRRWSKISMSRGYVGWLGCCPALLRDPDYQVTDTDTPSRWEWSSSVWVVCMAADSVETGQTRGLSIAAAAVGFVRCSRAGPSTWPCCGSRTRRGHRRGRRQATRADLHCCSEDCTWWAWWNTNWKKWK